MMFFAASLPSPPSPIIFEAGPFALRYYGLFIALGIAAATWVAGRELARRGYDEALALDSLLFIVPPGFLGARIYHVVTNWDFYGEQAFSEVFAVWNGGLAIYGAVSGGFLGVLLFSWYRGINPLVLADAAAPGVILGQAIGRWGNYFNQELFGRPTDLPWAIRIAPENRPLDFADAATFHPTFLYESLWNFLVFLTLLYVARRFSSNLKTGDVAVLYVGLYSLGRFFMELLRIDPAFIIGDTARGNMLVAVVLAIGFALVLFLRHSGSKKQPRVR